MTEPTDADGPDEAQLSHADRAYASLVRSIATCELPPGSLFNERDEAAKLGMSRTPFRQALHRLALEGLVVTVPKRGVYVSLLDPKAIHDNTVVREALEVEVMRRTILEDRAVDFTRIRDLLSRMQQLADDDDAEGFLRADEDFHLTLAETSGNRSAVEAVQRTWIHVNRVRYVERLDQSSLKAALREHRTMVTSLRKRDVVLAEASVRLHMERSRVRLVELEKLVPSAFLHAHGGPNGRLQPKLPRLVGATSLDGRSAIA